MVITIGMGEGAVAAAPHIIRAVGCGSCVILTLYDAKTKVGGMAHVMLPAKDARNLLAAPGRDEAYQYADTAVPALIEEMLRRGASREHTVAKMAGGAAMFQSYSAASAGIGRQNIEGVRDALRREGIPLAGYDTGGGHGRDVELHIASGRVAVAAFGKEDREI